MKGKAKRVLSGMLSVMTILTSFVQPMTTFAAEPEPAAYEAEYPVLDKVRAELSEDEIVTVQDYEMETGDSFDVESDFSGMELKDERVKVKFHEAKDENGQDFDRNRAGIYKAMYFVEPVSGNPSYHVVRKIIVKEPSVGSQAGKSSASNPTEQAEESESEEGEAEAHSEMAVEIEAAVETESEKIQTEIVQAESNPAEGAETEPLETARETELLSEKELNEALETAQEQDIVDEETGLTLGNVMLQAVEQGGDLLELEEGESVEFTAAAPMLYAARASQRVTVTAGSWYYYADYGLGSYLTCPYTVTFGDVTATAYCVQPSKPGPDDGMYTIEKLSDGKTLAKVCYYRG